MLAARAAEQDEIRSGLLRVQGRPSRVRFGDDAVDDLEAPAHGDVAARQRGSVVGHLRLRAHPVNVERDPGTIPQMQLVTDPVARAVASLVGAEAAGVGALEPDAHAASERGRVGVDAAEDVRVQVTRARLDHREGSPVVVPVRPDLDRHRAQRAVQPHAADTRQAHALQVDHPPVHRIELEAVSKHAVPPGSRAEGRERGGRPVVATVQRDDPGHLRDQLGDRVGPRRHDGVSIPLPDARGEPRGRPRVERGEVVEDRVGRHRVGLLLTDQRAVGELEAVAHLKRVGLLGRGGVRPGEHGENAHDRAETRTRPGRASGPGRAGPARTGSHPARLRTHSTRRRVGNPYPPFR